MRWESLSMRERAKLMNTYLRSGVTRLSDMRDHYNKFADGGEVDNIQSTPAQDFIASWLSNRQEQFKENFRNSGSTMVPYSVLPKSWSNKAAFKEYQNQLKNLRTVKQYDVLGNTKFPHVPESEFEAIKRLSNHTGGAYNPSSHSISYISPYAGTDVHELTHSLNADPQINTIRYGFEGDKLQEGKQYNSYKDSADEIYARLMQFRYLNKLDPKKKYTVEDIKKWREKYDDTDIINRYSDEYLLHLLNNVASTKSSLEKDGRKLAAYGGPLRNEYDNPDQYYDYKTAEEVGNMYDPGTQHWASRDPRTGMILKNPKHPTFGMAIREDMASGYSPYIDSSTGRYFTLSPEEYTTSPYKPTLHRVNSFDDGGDLGGAHGEVPFTTDYSKVPKRYKKAITLNNLHELAKNNPAVYREYMQKLPKEYQAKVIENAARSRYGYEGLNEAMFAVTGGLPGVVGDLAGRAGNFIGSKAADFYNLDKDSPVRKGIEIGLGALAGAGAGVKMAASDIGHWAKGNTYSMTHKPTFPVKVKPFKLFSSELEQEVQSIFNQDFPLIYVDPARRSRVISGGYNRVGKNLGVPVPSGREILSAVADFESAPGDIMAYSGKRIYIPQTELELNNQGIFTKKHLYQAYTHEAGHGMKEAAGVDFSYQPKDWPNFLDESKIDPTYYQYYKGNPLERHAENWDELIQRVGQVKDAAGITDGQELLSGPQLQKMFKDYTSDPSNIQNIVKEVEDAVTDWDEFAKWSNKFVPAVGLGAEIGIGSKKFKNN